ncbi:hypothetical protein [Vreelandella sp. EE22]
MLSLTHKTTLSVLRAVAAQHNKAKHTDMLPSAGTPERAGLIHSLEHLFGTRHLPLPDTSITLGEWAEALSGQVAIDYLNLHDTSAGAFCNRLQRSYRHASQALIQEAQALTPLLATTESHERTLISWLSLQTVSGFMLGALLPQQAGWQARSLFDSANTLWELNAGDIIATDSERWRQLAQRLPALPGNITAVATTPLEPKTYQALKDKGIARIVELYSEPALGVVAARHSQKTPFELLSHWHPTESDNYLLRLSRGNAMQEVKLSEPLCWAGARSFVQTEIESVAPAWAGRSLGLARERAQQPIQGASAA